MRPGSRGYVGDLQPPGTGMRMATGENKLYAPKILHDNLVGLKDTCYPLRVLSVAGRRCPHAIRSCPVE